MTTIVRCGRTRPRFLARLGMQALSPLSGKASRRSTIGLPSRLSAKRFSGSKGGCETAPKPPFVAPTEEESMPRSSVLWLSLLLPNALGGGPLRAEQTDSILRDEALRTLKKAASYYRD